MEIPSEYGIIKVVPLKDDRIPPDCAFAFRGKGSDRLLAVYFEPYKEEDDEQSGIQHEGTQ